VWRSPKAWDHAATMRAFMSSVPTGPRLPPRTAARQNGPSAAGRLSPKVCKLAWPCSGRMRLTAGVASYSFTFPDALIICWKATGGFVIEHLPFDLAAMPRTLRVAFGVPLIPL
jgi:hypothetical protein